MTMDSASSSSSTLSHYRPAVLTIIGVAAASCLYLVYSSHSHSFSTESQSSNLHRSNAVRRPRRRNGESSETQDNTRPAEERALDSIPEIVGTADDATTELSMDDGANPAGQSGDAQKLRELMYAISKNRAKNEGIVHRGVTCDNCGRAPIVGVRYHCSNCPDFDLCEDCEAQDVHLKTHVFYKVKVPAPWGGKQPLPLWYPGKPHELPAELPQTVKKKLSDETKCSSNEIDGYYTQWANLANTGWSDDQHSLVMAINRAAFDRCFLPQMTNRKFPEPSLIHDQLFNFYDSDKNGLIGFEEFVRGTVLVHNKDKDARKQRVFKGLDLDNDGLISRKDLLKMFRAHYVLNKNILLDYLKAERDGENATHVVEHHSARDILESSRPLASYFSHGQPEFGPNPNQHARKRVNEVGDLVPRSATTNTILERNNAQDLIDRRDIVARTWPNEQHMLEMDVRRVMEGRSPQWVNADQAQVFNIPPSENESGNLPAQKIKIDNAKPWIAYRSFAEKTVFLRVQDVDFYAAFGRPMRWNDPQEDDSTYWKLIEYVVRRLTHEVRQKVKLKGFTRIMERTIYQQFHLDDEKNNFLASENKDADNNDSNRETNMQDVDFSELDSLVDSIKRTEGHRTSDSKSNGVAETLDSRDEPSNSRNSFEVRPNGEEQDNEQKVLEAEETRPSHHLTNENDKGANASAEGTENGSAATNNIHSFHAATRPTQILPTFVGGTAGDQTIYEIMQQALNETLDPMFKPAETEALQVVDSKDERTTFKEKIGEWRKAMGFVSDEIFKFQMSRQTKSSKSKRKDKKEPNANGSSRSQSSASQSSENPLSVGSPDEDLALIRQSIGFKQSQLPIRAKFYSLGRPENGLSLLVPRQDQERIFDDLNQLLAAIHKVLPVPEEYQLSIHEHSDDFYVTQDLRKRRVGGFCLMQKRVRLATVLVFLELRHDDKDDDEEVEDLDIRSEEETRNDTNTSNSGLQDSFVNPDESASSSIHIHDGSSTGDPTLPQNRPDNIEPLLSSFLSRSLSPSGRESRQVPSTRRIAELASLAEAADKIEERGGPGKLDYAEFSEAIEATDEEGMKLLAWVGNWVDLVRF